MFKYPQEVFANTWPKIDGPECHSDQATWSGDGIIWAAPFYTASLDAAFSLMISHFRGTKYEFTNLYNIVRVTIEMNGEYGGFHGEHVNSLPIATR